MLRDKFFINCGNNEAQPRLSCRSVKYSSNVDTISLSTLRVPMRREFCGSSSNSIYKVQPRTPQGSRSETRIISDAMRAVRSQGIETSVQVKLRDFAARNSSSKRLANSLTAACSILSQYKSSSSAKIYGLLWLLLLLVVVVFDVFVVAVFVTSVLLAVRLVVCKDVDQSIRKSKKIKKNLISYLIKL